MVKINLFRVVFDGEADLSSTGPEVKAEFNEIRVGLEEELRATEGFQTRELLEPANRYRLALAFFMFCGQQCTGMTALAYFGPQFFKLIVGDNTDQSLLITGLFGAEKFITVGIYILFFSEMWGRKPTLWISALLMACCFIIVTVVKETTPKPDSKATPAGIGMVAMIFLTNSIYQFSWGPLPWPYTAEVRDLFFYVTSTIADRSRSSLHEFAPLEPQSRYQHSGCSTSSSPWSHDT